MYNLSYMDNVTNPLDILVGASAQTGNSNLIGILILLMFFSIYLMMAYTNDFLKVLLTGSFLTTILATLLSFTPLLDQIYIVYPMIMLMITMIIHFMS